MNKAINDTTWLGLPWAPTSDIPFPRVHKPAKHCENIPDFYHLGGRYYLSTSTRTLHAFQNSTPISFSLSPLQIFHFPCSITFPLQETGFGPCPKNVRIHIPIFTQEHISYVPWQSATDDSVLKLHYESLNIPPPSEFNTTTFDSLQNTYEIVDGRLGKRLAKIKTDIAKIKTTFATTVDQVLTYIALTLSLLSFFINIIFVRIYFKHTRRYPLAAPNTIVHTIKQPQAASHENIEMVAMPTCDNCHKPCSTDAEMASP